MGMFDDIKCQRKLPLNVELKKLKINWKEVSFQTKDLENCLLQYTISKNGRLLERFQEREYIEYSEEEKKNKNLRPWNLWKDVVIKNEYDKVVDHHGKINFYTNLEYTEEEDIWVEFIAYFVYGKLDKIELFRYEKTKSNRLHNKECEEQRLKENKKLWNRAKKFLNYLGWSWFWRKVTNCLYKISRYCDIARMFIFKNVA